MTPAARVAAAIEVLDAIQDGFVAEQALSRWARSHRFAGSKDRAAIRDHVFDALRSLRSAVHLGGGQDGRSVMIGLLRQQGVSLEEHFSGVGHAPQPLSEHEASFQAEEMPKAVAWNLPDWLVPLFEGALDELAEQAALSLMERAPISVRVNYSKTNTSDAKLMLSEGGIVAVENSRSNTALTITEGARRLRAHRAYLDGFVEPQDAASQAIVADLPNANTALDFCAGGGGKALAMAARGMTVAAHDINPQRMKDIPDRAARAGVRIDVLTSAQLKADRVFDLVLCDAPCSGSGSWRRAPEGKWQLSPERLKELSNLQDQVLDNALLHVAEDGVLVYATCSVLQDENEARVEAFLKRYPDWRCTQQTRYPIDALGDGFFAAHLTR